MKEQKTASGQAVGDYLSNWLRSARAEAPVLLTGPATDSLEAKAKDVTADKHTETVWLQSEGATVSVKQVRQLLSAGARTSFSKRRVLIIHQAEKLSRPAANALLKSLEENTNTTRYLLMTINPARLPATVRSRCVQVQMEPVPPQRKAGDEIEKIAGRLSKQLATRGPTPELKLAFTRLRDYYRIKSARGNEKLAREVLLASLPEDAA